jgi:hypothetical protein
MRKILWLPAVLVIVSLACSFSVDVGPTDYVPTPQTTPVLVTTATAQTTPVLVVTPTAQTTAVLADPPTATPEVFISVTQAIPATAVPRPTFVITPSPAPNTLATVGRLTLEIPSSVARGANGGEIPAATRQDLAEWQQTPGHLQVSLNDSYVLQGKSNQPQIRVYPAVDYAVLVPGAFESMHRLRNIVSGVVPSTPDQLPTVPFFNAAQALASNIETMPFQNGSGIRFLAQYAQGASPANNRDLVYVFQGFSGDGNYYIVAVFPITSPILPETGDPSASLPAGGIPFPSIGDPDGDVQGYYASIENMLNTTSPEAFTPSISQLDTLVRSLWVAP